MNILAISGSPRMGGNSDTLLGKFLSGAIEAGAQIEKVYAASLSCAACVACHQCFRDGECVIRDDIFELNKKIIEADGIVIASPVHFMTVSSCLKVVIDRGQPFWAAKFVLNKPLVEPERQGKRKGFFIGVAANSKQDIFAHTTPIARAYLQIIDAPCSGELLVSGLEKTTDIQKYPDKLQEAFKLGKEWARDTDDDGE